jgi:hypothetical protein
MVPAANSQGTTPRSAPGRRGDAPPQSPKGDLQRDRPEADAPEVRDGVEKGASRP